MIIDVPDEVVQRIYDIAHTGEEIPVGIQAILVRLIVEKGANNEDIKTNKGN